MLIRLFMLVVLSFPCVTLQAMAQTAQLSELIVVNADGLSHAFQVEVANTPASREQGLMFRESLVPGTGMLFDFGHLTDTGMWMKNTLIPLDILFITQDGEILNIHENAEPMSLERIYSAGPVRATLELAAGTVKRLGIKAGDRVIHSVFSIR